MGIGFDKGQNRNRQEQQKQSDLDKANLPDGQREDVRRQKPMDTRKGAEVLKDGKFGHQHAETGTPAPLDYRRHADQSMMAVVSVMMPELSQSRSSQAAALMKEFENPAVVRAYLINPEKTAQLLGQRFPEMRETLHKNVPFTTEGKDLRENAGSGLYKRVQQEVNAGETAKGSRVREYMDKLLISVGASGGMETKAYELIRNRIENKEFNAEGSRIEHDIGIAMKSRRAGEDLKQVAAIAYQSERTTPPSMRAPATTTQPAQPNLGIPTTTGEKVQGTLKTVATPPPPTELPKMVADKSTQGVGNAKPTNSPIPAPPKANGGIEVPVIKPSEVPTTTGAPVLGPLHMVPEAAPTIRPPMREAANPPKAIPFVDGGVVTGELKIVPSTPPVPASTPELKATPAPIPDPVTKAPTQQMEATIAKLEETLKKATDTTEAMMKKLQESEARNADLTKRLEESERRAQRMELKSDVNDILREQKKNIANGKELDQAITAITKPEQKDLPTAEQVATKVTELREQAKQKEIQAQKELVKKINDSFATLPANPGVTQTRDWTTKNMDLHNSLDDKGKKAFINYIKNNYQFQQDQETFNPMSFFNRKIADAAAQEIVNATRSKESYVPSRAMAPTRITSRVPDPVRIAEILRSVSDLKDVLPHIQANEEVQAVRNKLPKGGFFGNEDGIYQKAFDARLTGNKAEAEALFLRSLIDAGDLADPAQRKKVIREALGSDKTQSDQIREHYKRTFDTDLLADLKKANARQLAERESADAEVKKQEEALQKAKDKAKAAAAKVEDLLE